MSELTLQLIVTVKYQTNGVTQEWLEENLRQLVSRALGEGWFTEDSEAEVESHTCVIRPLKTTVSSDILEGPGNGYCVMLETVSEGLVVAVKDQAGKPIVFKTREAAEAEIADFVIDKWDEYLEGEREFDDAVTVEEFLLEVQVDEDGTIFDEDDTVWWPPETTKEPEAPKLPDPAIAERRALFMSINAKPADIARWLNRKARSVNWTHSAKKDMADAYATKATYGRRDGQPVITDALVRELIQEFGRKGKR